MRLTRSALPLLLLAAAVVVFCIVQDRVTAAGARANVAHQRAALAGRAEPVTIDEVMRPTVARSVRQGLLWGGVVLIAGLAGVVTLAPPMRHEDSRSGDRRE
jgi:hypothetical protein